MSSRLCVSNKFSHFRQKRHARGCTKLRRVLLQTAEGLALRVCVCAGSFVRRWRLVGTPRRIFTDSVVARTGRGRGRARGLETGARSEGLSQLAQHFKAQATKAKRFQMWQHSKFGAVVGGAASPLAWRSLLSPPYSTIICACWCACRLYMRHTQHARTRTRPHAGAPRRGGPCAETRERCVDREGPRMSSVKKRLTYISGSM